MRCEGDIQEKERFESFAGSELTCFFKSNARVQHPEKLILAGFLPISDGRENCARVADGENSASPPTGTIVAPYNGED